MDIRDELTDRRYWELLSHVWMDTEFPWQKLTEWMALWGSNRPEKIFAMRQDEREAFEAMPDEMTVYRGSAFPDRYGISWTLDRDIAAKFARRFHRESYLLTAKIKKSDVHVYLGRRNEREIIVERFDVLQRKAVWG